MQVQQAHQPVITSSGRGPEERTDICAFAGRPFAFMARYVRARWRSHALILSAVVAAVGCSVTTQYGIRNLIDALSGPPAGNAVWAAFLVLVALIAADNLLWRVASFTASVTFVRVTGDLRRDLFHHLTGHSLAFFAERQPGTLTGRLTATANAVFAIENMVVWNVLPPCAATVAALGFIMTLSVPMGLALSAVAALMVLAMFRFAAAGGPLHHDFARKAAAVDGEMVDVIGNMPMVRAFGGLMRELRRFGTTVEREMNARSRSLLYLERLRVTHAVVTTLLIVGLLAWAIVLWQRGEATTGDVVLACTLGLSVLHATRDLSVALVDVTQHVARLSEALATLLVPHTMRDHPEAGRLVKRGASVAFADLSFSYPDGHRVFERLNLAIEPGQRVGLVGPSGSGKSTLLALLQRFYDPQAGQILIDGQDIARVTQESLRDAIAIVPQDISLFHRTLMENIRYSRPDAADAEVMEAAAAARCDFIALLPQGIATVAGERGVKLSGGQRQRIAIARAFLKDAPLLLLDEATSALDNESEIAIRDASDRLMRGRTVIAIAHRLSTIRHFDRVIVLQAGRIVQDGAPDELLQVEGAYRRLVQDEMKRLSRAA